MITIPEEYWTGAHTVKTRLPYLTPQSVYRLDHVVKPTFRVLEFGAGGSTLFFSDRCQSVISVEPNKAWISLLKKELSLTNVWFYEYTIKEQLGEFLKTIPDGSIDLLLVDSDDYWFKDMDYEDANGQPATRSRTVICNMTLSKLSANGFLVLDNYSRPWYQFPFLISEQWVIEKYDDPHWDGAGTLVACKK